ncbi:MAG: methylmalonyl Co-A mutase-associated GTPase MeaB [Vicingaceae bacterium]
MQNKNFKRKKAKKPSAKQLIEGVLAGDFIALSRAITLCESKRAEDREAANKIVQACLPHSGNSIRIGITGVPGVGKSTFIESFGLHLIEKERKKLAVLAVDPSSERSKGSILGDKTRMEKLSVHPKAFIRPSPTSGSLGGVAHQSRESIILCEAAGFEVIIVETVGVGQSETEVRQMTDFFLLLMLAGAGDELQGIKRGIMEMADGLLINKAEGENQTAAKRAQREYRNALHLFPPSVSEWTAKVELCSALKDQNMDGAWQMVQDFVDHTQANGFFEKQRQKQLRSWFIKTIDELLHRSLFSSENLKSKLRELEQQVEQKEISPYEAAKVIFEAFKKEV